MYEMNVNVKEKKLEEKEDYCNEGRK